MSEWNPIESAPIDKLVWVYGVRFGSMGYTEDKLCMTSGRFHRNHLGVAFVEEGGRPMYSSGYKPTHWTPYPEPPK